MELLEIIINASQEAFLHVGVILGIVILGFGYVDYKTEGNIVSILEKNKKIQPIIGAILGVMPGCGGSILLIPLYTKRKVSFGALIATLIASIGDAAFILISSDIKIYLIVSIISFITAIIFGYGVDILNLDKKLNLRDVKTHNCTCNNDEKTDIEMGINLNFRSNNHIGHEEYDEVDHALHHNKKRKISKLGYNFTHFIGYKIYYLIIIIGFIFSITSHIGGIEHAHEHLHDHSHEESIILSFEMIISLIGLVLSIIYMILSKKNIENSTHEIVESKILSFKEMVVHSASETAFVITWIFIGYLVYDIGVLLVGGQEIVNQMMLSSGILSVLVGALLGIVPGCGIQIIFISLYAKGAIPFAALIANSISQDGDALFPLIAMDKKSALWATILTTIPALLIGFIVYFI